MTTDRELASAFDREVDSYERARPGYPAAALAHLAARLGLRPGSRVLDLGAGTGKLTRDLVGAGYDVVAVEPLPAMRTRLAGAVPAARVLDGAAEAIPLPDAAVDAITVAQAFHWFDLPRAVPEMARVLAPGGGIALLWNERDDRVPWVAELTRITHWDTHAPFDIRTDWAQRVGEFGLFGTLAVERFPFAQPMTSELLVDMVRSRSYIAVLPPAERDAIFASVRALVDGWPEPFDLPFICHVWTATAA